VGFGRNTVAYKSPAAAKADLLSGARDNGLDADARLEKLEALLRSRP
ncbi:MAG: hypothetical protein HY926_13245, partial [Elusimicrobia bacterium]|nr:hypothetical protein [Elusimicrobiota bacterium]